MVGELTINQRENLQKFTTPNNNINRCFFEKLRGREEGGAYGQGQKTGGALTSREKKDYINVLKLRAVKYTILTFFHLHANALSICIQMDNIVAISYLVKMGGTRNKSLTVLSKKIWDYLLTQESTREYLPGLLNLEEDTQSRTVSEASKWELNPSLFQKICKYRGTPEMDIFSNLTSIILKEDSVRPSNTNSSNPSMADTVLVLSVSEQMSIKNPLLLSSISNLLIGPNKKNNQLIENKTCNSWNGQFQGNAICRRIIRKVCHLYCKCQKTTDSLSLRIGLA